MGQTMTDTTTRARLVALLAAILAGYMALLPIVAPDYINFLQPWLAAIRASDGLSIFATDFSNYTGGYPTVLWAWSFLAPAMGEHLVIKAAGLTGTALCAWAFLSCLGAAGIFGSKRALGTLLFVALPSVALNGAALAQADAYYTAFVLWSLAAVLKGRLALAGIALCVAVSFKLQAMFFAPFLLGVMLRDMRAMALSAAALLPAYLAVNGIYLAGGRSLSDVLAIYTAQVGTYESVWMHVANPWFLVHASLSQETLASAYSTLVLAGLGAGALAGVAIVYGTVRSARHTPSATLRWAALAALAMPFILPKMHDRYFFLAEVLLLALALTDRRFWPSALLAQASAIFAYSMYYDTLGIGEAIGHGLVAPLALTFMLATVASFIRAWPRQSKPAPDDRLSFVSARA